MVRQYQDDYYYDDPIEEHKPANRSWMVSLSLATILALIVIGDTIGGLVTVNNRTHIEFGQGAVLTVPCDRDGLTVKPVANYADNAGNREFLFDSLTLSNISDQCLNRLFQFKFYTLSGSSPIVIGEKLKSGASSYDADSVKFLLSRVTSNDPFDAGLYWSTWKNAANIGNPPNAPSFNRCGGNFDAVKDLNLEYTNSDFLNDSEALKVDCLNSNDEYNNVLNQFNGFLTVPGSDGSEVNVNLSFESYGNAQLFLDDLKVLSLNIGNESASTSTTTLKLRRGESYPFDLWVLKNNKPLLAKLSWDMNSSGNQGTRALVPRSAFSTAYLSEVKIAPTEGVTDYSVAYTKMATNDREVKIQFVKKIPSSQIQFLTLETS